MNCESSAFSDELSDMHVRRIDPYAEKLNVNGKGVPFEIDTGCSLTVMNEHVFLKAWNEANTPDVKPIRIHLETYTCYPVKVIGVASVKVKYKQQSCKLPLVVVSGNGLSLLGWFGWRRFSLTGKKSEPATKPAKCCT